MKNPGLNALIIGTLIALVLILLQDPGSQRSLVYYLGLEKDDAQVSSSKKADNSKIEKAIVSRVIDGDTVVLDDGRTIRYLNADTPETKKPNTVVQCYGLEASSYNKNLVEGKNVLLLADKENEDKYGRDLRFVFLEGKNTDNIENSVNAALVKSGYARSMIVKPNNTYETLFQKLQYDAQTQKIGLWGKCAKPFVE